MCGRLKIGVDRPNGLGYNTLTLARSGLPPPGGGEGGYALARARPRGLGAHSSADQNHTFKFQQTQQIYGKLECLISGGPPPPFKTPIPVNMGTSSV